MSKFLKVIVRILKAISVENSGYRMSKGLRERIRTPRVNVDGTPMAGRHDIRGRGYGSGGGYKSSKF